MDINSVWNVRNIELVFILRIAFSSPSLFFMSQWATRRHIIRQSYHIAMHCHPHKQIIQSRISDSRLRHFTGIEKQTWRPLPTCSLFMLSLTHSFHRKVSILIPIGSFRDFLPLVGKKRCIGLLHCLFMFFFGLWINVLFSIKASCSVAYISVVCQLVKECYIYNLLGQITTRHLRL